MVLEPRERSPQAARGAGKEGGWSFISRTGLDWPTPTARGRYCAEKVQEALVVGACLVGNCDTVDVVLKRRTSP